LWKMFGEPHIGIPVSLLNRLREFNLTELWILLYCFKVRVEGADRITNEEVESEFGMGKEQTEVALARLETAGWLARNESGEWIMGVDGRRQEQTSLLPVVHASDEEAEALRILRAIPGFPKNDTRTIEVIRNAMRAHPEIDLLPLVRDWAAYKRDVPLERKSNPYSQMTNQFVMAEKRGRYKRGDGQVKKAAWK